MEDKSTVLDSIAVTENRVEEVYTLDTVANESVARIPKLKTALWITLNIAVVVGVVFFNKAIFQQYTNSGITLTLSHMWMTCLALTIANLVGYFEYKKSSHLQIFILALLNSSAIVFSNLSLQYSPVTVYQIFKVLITPSVGLFQYLFWPKSVTTASAISLIIITAGGLVSVAAPSNSLKTTMPSIFYSVMAMSLSALTQIMTGIKLKELELSPTQLLYSQAPMNCLIIMVYVIFLEPTSFGIFHTNDQFLKVLLLGSFLAPLINLSQNQIIHRTSPLMYNVTSQLKSVLIILGSILFLSEHLTIKSFAGLVILLIGVALYISNTNSSTRINSSSNSVPLTKVNKANDFENNICSKLNWYHFFILIALVLPIGLTLAPPNLYKYYPNFYLEKMIFSTPAPATPVTPRIVHYVWANEHQVNQLSLTVFVSVAASYHRIKPDKIYFHHSDTNNFTGIWYDRIKKLATFTPADVPQTISGRTPYWVQHISDVMRLNVIEEYGGIYFDTDIIPLKSFDDLIDQDKTVLGYQPDPNNINICNAVIITPPKAPFIHLWQKHYNESYYAECWDCDSVRYPGNFNLENPGMAKVYPVTEFFDPGWEKCGDLLDDGKAVNVSKSHSIHLWGYACLQGRNMDVDQIRKQNSTFSNAAHPFISEKYLEDLDNGRVDQTYFSGDV